MIPSRGRRAANDVVVVQTNIPDYRAPFFELLRDRLGSRFLLVSGSDDFAESARHVDSQPHLRARNRYLAGRRLLWQSGVIGPVFRANVAVLILNPRILTVWLALVVRRAGRKRTVLWGHAWPRQGRRAKSDVVRQVMRRLADTIIVYTETQARELREHMHEVDVVAAPNALYRAAELEPAATTTEPRDFVCVGRLVAAKKPDLLLEAFCRAAPRLPANVRLVFVGEGPLRPVLEQRAQQAGLAARVLFRGHVSTVDDLRAVYAEAIASVSPGYAGLSLVQSLGFGVPMLVARDEPHAPEIEAAVEGVNVEFVPSDSPDALASALVGAAERRKEWLVRRPEIVESIRRAYSIDAMVQAFVAALRLDNRPAPGRRDH
jgi:glycosyltransferase involved in cell wall biosynthesis